MSSASEDHDVYFDGQGWKSHTPEGPFRKSKANVGRISSSNYSIKRKRSESDTSLVSLTRHFVSLLMKAPGWRLNMNEAAEALSVVNSKRRLYDVTGVLLGAELVTKPSKNIIAWTGFESMDEYRNTSKEIAALLEVEKRIDRALVYMRGMIEKVSTLGEAYLTKEDVAHLYKDKTVLFMKGPTNTDLLVPTTMSDVFMFSLKSQGDPIDVFLFSDAEDETAAEADASDTESVEVSSSERKTAATTEKGVFDAKHERSTRSRALKDVSNKELMSFRDSASVLLRGLYPGPFQESELSPRKTKKHAMNFIPLEPLSNENKPPIASYCAGRAACRAPYKRMRKS